MTVNPNIDMQRSWAGLLSEGLSANKPATPQTITPNGVAMYFATDTGVLWIYAAGAWESLGGSAASATFPWMIAPSALVPPQTGGNWSYVDSSQGNGSVSNNGTNGFIITSGAGADSTAAGLYMQTISNLFSGSVPATWTVRAGICFNPPWGLNYFSLGMALWYSGGAEIVSWGMDASCALTVGSWTSRTLFDSELYQTASDNSALVSISNCMLFLYIYYDGTNYNFYVSPDGIQKTKLYSAGTTAELASAADYIGLICAWSGDPPYTATMNVFDWKGYSGTP